MLSRYAPELDKLEPELGTAVLARLISRTDVMVGIGDYDPATVLFTKWLVEQGYLEPVPVRPVHLDAFTLVDDPRHRFRITIEDSLDTEPSTPSP